MGAKLQNVTLGDHRGENLVLVAGKSSTKVVSKVMLCQNEGSVDVHSESLHIHTHTPVGMHMSRREHFWACSL